MTRAWLDVPFREHREARQCGARWDPSARRWYAPRPGMAQLARWAALPSLPLVLPGEDRLFGRGLFVDLVPASCWFTHARSAISARDWERVRRMVTSRAGDACEVCLVRANRAMGLYLEVHERWAYSAAEGVQGLRRLICLCTRCHQVTHFGHAQTQGREDEAVAHLRAVTGMSDTGARLHVEHAFQVWQDRSRREWDLDLTMLTGAGITLAVSPGGSSQRASLAALATGQARRDEPRWRSAWPWTGGPVT